MSERTRLRAIEEHLNNAAMARNDADANNDPDLAARWAMVAFLGEIAYQLAVMNERHANEEISQKEADEWDRCICSHTRMEHGAKGCSVFVAGVQCYCGEFRSAA